MMAQQCMEQKKSQGLEYKKFKFNIKHKVDLSTDSNEQVKYNSLTERYKIQEIQHALLKKKST